MVAWTYFEPMNGFIPSRVSAWSNTTCQFSSNLAPKTMPPLLMTFSASIWKMPPEELCFLIFSSRFIAASTFSGARSSLGCNILHAFSHRPHWTQSDVFTCGYRKPSLSAIIEMHDFGQTCAHAPQPQQSSALLMSIMPCRRFCGTSK